MMTFSTFLARYGIGGGRSPRRRMPKVSLMSGFENRPRARQTSMPTLSDGGSCGRAYRWGLSLEAGTSPEQPVVQVESVYAYNGLFHSCHCKGQEPNFRSALHRIAEAQRSVVNPSRGSVRVVPNSAAWRKGAARNDNCRRRKG